MSMDVLIKTGQGAVLTTKHLDQFKIDLTPESLAEAERLVDEAQQVELVENEFTQKLAVETMQNMKQYLSAAEKTRKELKAPITALGKRIEAAFDKGVGTVQTEFDRIKTMLNTYTNKLMQERLEAERKQRLEMERLERERRELEQKAAMEQNEAIRKELEAQRKQVIEQEKTTITMPVPVVKAEGTKMRMRWDYQIDLNELAARRPDLCKIEARVREISNELDQGITIPGIINPQKVPDVRV